MRRMLIRARNIIAHILFLVILFIGSVFFFARTINQVTPDTAETMAASTFPLVYMVRNGTSFNCLHGYAREMDVTRLRDSITPLSADREIGLRVQTFSTSIDSISYEVLSLDGMQSLENTQVIKTQQENDDLTATLQLQNQMLMNQEYVLKLKLVSGGRDIYYYTHVLLADGLHTDDYLNFVSGFYDKTINRTDLNTVGAAVEPDETTDAEQTLAYMDIHDSVTQLTWGSLLPQIYYKPTPRITEINRNTATLTMDYRIAAVDGSGKTEVYNVREAYRVRFTDSRVFLLNFERTTDEVFEPENDVLEETGIRLGITDKDVEYKADEKNRIVAFVQENELWTYERSTSKLTQIFSFPMKENMDYRDFYDASEIRVLQVNTNGDVWFTVSGYMNRGTHEGDNGISVCHYEASTAMVDEKIFIQCMETGEMLTRDVDALSYISEDHSAYCLLLDGALMRVDLASRSYEVVAEGIRSNCHAVSESGRYFSWLPDGEEYGSATLRTIDLETMETIDTAAGGGEKIRPVCYMNEDLVYGIAKDQDIAASTLQTGYFPMYRMVIADPEGNVIKNYQPEGLLVTDVAMSDHMLSLTRVYRDQSGQFAAGTPDEIVDTATSDSVALGTATKSTDRKQTIVYLRVGASISDLSAEVIRSKIIAHASAHTLMLAGSEREDLYYVYAAGRLQDVYARANMAVAQADSKVGVVVDGIGRYIWVRGDRSTSAEIALDKVPAALGSGTADAQEIAALSAQENADAKVLDMTGCSLDQMLYFISHGSAVAAMADDRAVTIVGYDEFNTYLLNEGEAEWYYYGINDSTEMFARSGNRFCVLFEPADFGG